MLKIEEEIGFIEPNKVLAQNLINSEKIKLPIKEIEKYCEVTK